MGYVLFLHRKSLHIFGSWFLNNNDDDDNDDDNNINDNNDNSNTNDMISTFYYFGVSIWKLLVGPDV